MVVLVSTPSSLINTHETDGSDILRRLTNANNAEFIQPIQGYRNTGGSYTGTESAVFELGYSNGPRREEIDLWLERYWVERRLRKTGPTLDEIVCPKCGKVQRRPHAFKVTLHFRVDLDSADAT